MTNKQAKDELYRLLSDMRTYPLMPIRNEQQVANYMKGMELAIKSLDMWDKVIEEIKESKKACIIMGGSERAYGLYDALKIIEEYKKEIAESEVKE